METTGNLVELPPLEKLNLASSDTEYEAAPSRLPNLQRQEVKTASEASGTDGKDQAAGSFTHRPGLSGSNVPASKQEPDSPHEADKEWAFGINPEVVREMPMATRSAPQPPVLSQTPSAYATVRPHTLGFRSYSYDRTGRGDRNCYCYEYNYDDDDGDSYYDDLNLSVHDIL